MIDFLGKELCVGATVVAAISHGRNSGSSLTTGVVSKITNAGVKLTGTRTYNGCLKDGELMISSFKVVRID